jgi:hypothetical protein
MTWRRSGTIAEHYAFNDIFHTVIYKRAVLVMLVLGISLVIFSCIVLAKQIFRVRLLLFQFMHLIYLL